MNTIGRLGRWKRVLNPRITVGAGGNSQLQVARADPLDIPLFNLESNATGDLLIIRGGVEQYLKMIDQQSTTNPSLASSLVSTSSIHSNSVRSSSHPSSPNMISPAISLPGTPRIGAKDVGNLDGGGVMTNVSSMIPVSPSVSSAGNRDGGDPDVETPMAQTSASKVTSSTPRSGPGSPIIGADLMSGIKDVVPLEILQSRVLTRPSTSTDSGVGSPASGRIRSRI